MRKLILRNGKKAEGLRDLPQHRATSAAGCQVPRDVIPWVFNLKCFWYNELMALVKRVFYKEKGITLIELLIVLGIFFIFAAISVQVFRNFQENLNPAQDAKKIFSVLQLAKSKTLASEQQSQYGVYFDTSTNPHQYLFFKGESYSLRDPLFDKPFSVSDKVEIYQIDLGGGSEIVFNRFIGAVNQQGSISLRLKADNLKTQSIYINNLGQISFTVFPVPSDEDRLKDSRHIHFDYSRLIDIDTETITLVFTYNSSTTTYDIVLAGNVAEGQIFWEGEIETGEDSQRIKIHTHRLNNPDTEFCIHRDKRYNSKALDISISGDGSGNLVEYSVDGLSVFTTSIYASNLLWQ